MQTPSRPSPRSGRESTKPGTIFDLDGKSRHLGEMDAKTQEPDFWNDREAAQRHLKEIKQLRLQVEPWEKAAAECADLMELAESTHCQVHACMAFPESIRYHLEHLEDNLETTKPYHPALPA